MTAPALPVSANRDLPANVRRTIHARAHAATLMTRHGTTWAAVKAWAATQTLPGGRARWMSADLTRPINPAVVQAWADAHATTSPDTGSGG